MLFIERVLTGTTKCRCILHILRMRVCDFLTKGNTVRTVGNQRIRSKKKKKRKKRGLPTLKTPCSNVHDSSPRKIPIFSTVECSGSLKIPSSLSWMTEVGLISELTRESKTEQFYSLTLIRHGVKEVEIELR